jgi:hypothetical protein
MAAVRMNISLPEKVAKKLRKQLKPRERSRAIAEGLELYFEKIQKADLLKTLIEDYKSSADLDEESNSWLNADLVGNNDED